LTNKKNFATKESHNYEGGKAVVQPSGEKPGERTNITSTITQKYGKVKTRLCKPNTSRESSRGWGISRTV